MTEPANTPPAATEPTAPGATPSTAAASSTVAPPPVQPAAVGPTASARADGAKPQRRGLIGWFTFYAEDLLAPIIKQRQTCERCKRRMWRGYLLSAPASGVKGVSDIQIVCWRCKLSAAQQEMARLRTTGRR
ncbi:MAG: hypothetical protein HY208_03150 [Nitrospirae bacterium]|nr:hypothetical protein [Nitrospirota bacterium]